MAGTSFVWPLYTAVAQAINGDAGVAALLGGDRVYSLKAPTGASFDYIVLGGISEETLYAFMHSGGTLALQIHLWCLGADAMRCGNLYGELHRVLNGASLDIGAVRSTCALRLIDIQPDPHDEYVHGVARLDVSAI